VWDVLGRHPLAAPDDEKADRCEHANVNLNVHFHALVLDGMFTHADHDVVCHPVHGGWNQTVREHV
jgi:hypothetical protein